MATAKKQPSGTWKIRVYSHADTDGTKHYRSFTGTTKQEAEQAAATFANSAERRARVDLTVSEAIDGYIRSREGVLSPSTIRGYRRMQRNNYSRINHMMIRKLTTEQIQLFISELSKEMSAKSVKNIHGLLVAAIAFYMPDRTFRIKLPPKQKKRSMAATDSEVAMLYNAAPEWLRICIGLAAFCGLRRGEISALKYGDISGNAIYVHADMVQGTDGKYVYKEMPKTQDSVRTVYMPPELAQLIGTGPADDFIIKKYTGSISVCFQRLCKKMEVSGIRFHDLRGYYASIGAVLVPDTYLARFGGWTQSSNVMKEIYTHEIEDMSKMYAKTMTTHFSAVIQNGAF